MMSCNTGFHDRCDGCTCTCHPVTLAPIPATRHVALQDANEDDWDDYGVSLWVGGSDHGTVR